MLKFSQLLNKMYFFIFINDLGLPPFALPKNKCQISCFFRNYTPTKQLFS